MNDTDKSFFAGLSNGVVRHRRLFMLAWVVVAVALNVMVPQLERVIEDSSTPALPDEAPATRAFTEMSEKFGSPGANSMAVVVLTNDQGLSVQDHRYYADLVARLRAEETTVASVQDVHSQPELKKTLDSRDGQATYIPVGLRGEIGSPETATQVGAMRQMAESGRPENLQVHVTGAAATVADMESELEDRLLPISVVTVGLITIILLLIYRSIGTSLIALITIGVSLATARAVTALCGISMSIFSVSTLTTAFLTAVVLGAGTDYAVFLISRYHEYQRAGYDHARATALATRRVAAVITASAATVIFASGGMAVADVSIFRATGPPIAVSVLSTLLVALTLTPALLSFAASRGYVQPREQDKNRRPSALNNQIVQRPGRVLAIGLVVLGLFSAAYPTMRLTYDERSVQSASTDGNLGYAALNKHFSTDEILPEYVVVTADHDMRNAKDLAALENAATSISKVPGVASLSGITRPTGRPITEASLGYQAGQVGGRAKHMSSVATQLADGSRRLTDGVRRSVDGADRLLAGMNKEHAAMESAVDGTERARAASNRLATGAEQLAGALQLARQQTKLAVDGLEMVHSALDSDRLCDLDPTCRQARSAIGDIYVAQRDRLLPGLMQAADAALRIADGNGQLESGSVELRNGLIAAQDGMSRLAEGQRLMRDKLGELAAGGDRLSAGSRELAGAIGKVADFLRNTGARATDPAIGGFYLPSNAFDQPRMALSSGMFMSEDGRTTRMLVRHATDPFQPRASERTVALKDAARQALRHTPLANSDVGSTGMASINKDLEVVSAADFLRFACIAFLVVFLVLIVLLRCLVAPLYLLASVVLSYTAAMGVSVLAWQHVLNTHLHWSVPAITFVILVAVGADYNLLLVNRIQEETSDSYRDGIARAMAASGKVIATAGVIFAVSMFALMSGNVTILSQIGCTIGIGLLLDTFVVRRLIVPATAALLGQWSWWPSWFRRVHKG